MKENGVTVSGDRKTAGRIEEVEPTKPAEELGSLCAVDTFTVDVEQETLGKAHKFSQSNG